MNTLKPWYSPGDERMTVAEIRPVNLQAPGGLSRLLQPQGLLALLHVSASAWSLSELSVSESHPVNKPWY